MRINMQAVEGPVIHRTERRANNLILELESLKEASEQNTSTVNSFNLLYEVLKSANILATAVKVDFAKPLEGTRMGEQLEIMRGHRADIRDKISSLRETIAKSKAIVAESKRMREKAMVGMIG